MCEFYGRQGPSNAGVVFHFFGALLTNLDFLPKEASPFITGIAEVGIILIMFALGFEESTSRFVKSVRKTWGIAFFGELVPFIVAYSVSLHYWNNNAIALLTGLCMTATAVSLTMVSLKEEGLGRSRAAIGIMTAAVLDDIASLALVAVLVPIATGAAELTVASLAIVMLQAIAFFALVTALSMWILPAGKDAGLFSKIPFLGSHGIQRIFRLRRWEKCGSRGFDPGHRRGPAGARNGLPPRSWCLYGRADRARRVFSDGQGHRRRTAQL